jgi:hypothetical protein
LEKLGGSVVAYAYGGSSVIVRSLLTGHILHRVSSVPSMSIGVGARPIITLVIKGDGSVAWIVETGVEEPSFANHFVRHKEYAVFALDKTGTHQLAKGKNIDPQSFRLVGSALHWVQGGERASAVLN